MTIRCAAVFEKGVLRPLTMPELAEGEQVELVILSQNSAVRPRTPVEMLAAIAALPREGDGDPSTSQDHDRVLYGEKGAR